MKISDLPEHYNCVDILEHNLAMRADKVALYSAEREMTFRQVSREVNQAGNALKKLGLRIGDTAALLSLDLPEWVTSFFGVVKAGGVAVSLSTALTPKDYAYMLDDCRARILIVSETLLPQVEEIQAGRQFLEWVIVIGRPARESHLAYEDLIHGESTEMAAACTHRDDFCTLNYTSGTTGQPKGIPHAHKDMPISSQLYTVNTLGLNENDRTFSVARLFFTYGLGVNLFSPWHVGASTVLCSKPPRVAANVLETIDRFKPTVLFSVPTAYASLLTVKGFERYNLCSLRMCVAAGEALPAPVWHSWKNKTGLEIVESMGTTEAFALFLSNEPGAARCGTVGKVVQGFELRIADENGNESPLGEVGDLFVKGETSSLFYLHQYQKSRLYFRGEWLYTGDKFYVDADGFYHYAGRADDMLKAGGIWVSPVEIEQTLRAHEAVFECCVMAYPERDELIKPKAFVVLRDGYAPSEEMAKELIEHCKANMAAYKRPRWIEFMSDLPKTATGKIQRSALRYSAPGRPS
ncbi:MAG: benzoate-CoA ligase family protein [Acidobacteria bacterium]|nr:benzoate-CoA ligase family protein [Acidobacteriota bacterium]